MYISDLKLHFVARQLPKFLWLNYVVSSKLPTGLESLYNKAFTFYLQLIPDY